jgi:hypothetical protein
MDIIDISHKAVKVTDRDAAWVKIHNALSVQKYEVPFRRHLGTTLETFLFMPFSFSTGILLLQAIKRELPLNCSGYKVLPSSTLELDEENLTYNLYLFVQVEGLTEMPLG